MGTEQLLFSWRDHQNDVLNSFQELFLDQDLVDVTLACDGVSLEAHKIVLSAFSPYFRTLFQNNRCKHPIVIIAGVKYRDMKAVVDFMYNGDVNVPREHLIEFLKTANMLQIKGLSGPIDNILNSTYSLESGDVQSNISNEIPLVLREKATQQKSGHETVCTEAYPSRSSSSVVSDTEYSQDVSYYINDESNLIEAVTVKNEPEDDFREFPNMELRTNSLFVTENSSAISNSTPSQRTLDSSEKQHLEEQVPQTISFPADISSVPVLLSQSFTPFQTIQDQENNEVLLPDDTAFQNTSAVSSSGCTESNVLQAMLVSIEEPKVLVNYGMPFNDGKSPRKETIPEDSSTTNLNDCPTVSDLETDFRERCGSMQNQLGHRILKTATQRLTERHFISKIPPTKKKANPQKRCRVCAKNRIRRETTYHCAICNVDTSPCKKSCTTAKAGPSSTSQTKRKLNSLQSRSKRQRLNINYINFSKFGKSLPFQKHVIPKSFNPDYDCKCSQNCSSRISKETRVKLFNKFWSMGTRTRQDAFIQDTVSETNTSYKYNKNCRRNYDRVYKLAGITVCYQMYASVMKINTYRISQALCASGPFRTHIKYRNMKIATANKYRLTSKKITEVMDHFLEFFNYASHHSNINLPIEFISNNLPLRKLYYIYKRNTAFPVNYYHFTRIFKNYFILALNKREWKDTSQPLNSNKDQARQMKATPKNQMKARLQFNSNRERNDTSQPKPMNSNKDKAKQMEATAKNQMKTRLQFDSSRQRKDTSQPLNSNKDKARQMKATPKNQMKARLQFNSNRERNDTSQPKPMNKDKAKQMEATPKNQMKTRLPFASSRETKDTSPPMNSDKAKQMEAMPKNQMKTRLQFNSNKNSNQCCYTVNLVPVTTENGDNSLNCESNKKTHSPCKLLKVGGRPNSITLTTGKVMKAVEHFNRFRDNTSQCNKVSVPVDLSSNNPPLWKMYKVYRKDVSMPVSFYNYVKIFKSYFKQSLNEKSCIATTQQSSTNVSNVSQHNAANNSDNTQQFINTAQQCRKNKFDTTGNCKLDGRPSFRSLSTNKIAEVIDHFNKFCDSSSQCSQIGVPVDPTSNNPPLQKMYEVYKNDVTVPVSYYNYVKVFNENFKHSKYKGNAIKILNINNDVTNRNNSCDGKQRKEQPLVDKQNAKDKKMSNSNKIASHQHHTSQGKPSEAKTSKSDLLDKQDVAPKPNISISAINIAERNLTKASLLDEESANDASTQLTKDTRQQSLNDISSSRIAAVIDHFNEFHNFVSRHNKRNVPLEFVNSNLPLMKMYKLYRAEVLDPVSYCSYLNIFRANFKCLKEKDRDIDKHKDHQPKEGKITLNNQNNTFKLREKTSSEGTDQNNKSASFDQCMLFTTATLDAQNSNSAVGSEKNNMPNHQVNGYNDITWKHAVVHLDKITIPLKLQKDVSNSNEVCNSDGSTKGYSVGHVESSSKLVIHQDSQLQNVLPVKNQEIISDENDNEKLCHSNTVVNNSLVKLTAENKTNTFDSSHRKDSTNIDPVVDNSQKFEIFHTEEMSVISELLSEIIDSIQDSDMLKDDTIYTDDRQKNLVEGDSLIKNVDSADAVLDKFILAQSSDSSNTKR